MDRRFSGSGASPDLAAAHATKIKTLTELREAIGTCRRCSLYRHATQAVPGEGAQSARVMLIGEHPGNDEDLAGHPFVGPAGRVLDAALRDAAIDRRKVFVTNAVKHFKFEPRGKRRLHKRPNAEEIEICAAWNEIERAIVKPDVCVALGASAARSLMRKSVTISKMRGHVAETPAGPIIVTVHQSYILRIPDEPDRRRAYRAFVADLKLCRPFIE